MEILRQVRSALGLLVTLAVFIPGFLYQYLVLVPLTALLPSRAARWRAAFTKGMAHLLLGGLRVGGARFTRRGTIPTGAPCVVVGNHQSLADPAILISMSEPWVPAFVTRALYGKVPVIGLSMRWANCPEIDPRRDPRGALETIAQAAGRLEHGLLIFPEGHRTVDGEIRPFRPAGLIAILTVRRMPVYLAVSDGLWTSRRLVDFVFNVHRMRGITEIVGPFAPPEDEAAIPEFIESLRARMIAHLAGLRSRDERAA